MKENEVETTTTEETKVEIDSTNESGTDASVSTETSVEQKSTEEKSSNDGEPSESNVNVKVENNFPSDAASGAAATHDPNKNYEAAQPVVDPIV